MTRHVAYVIDQPSAFDAVRVAKERARADGLALRTICSIKGDPGGWRVELAVAERHDAGAKPASGDGRSGGRSVAAHPRSAPKGRNDP